MFKRLTKWLLLGPLRKTAGKKLIPVVFETLQGYVSEYAKYNPLKIYLSAKLHRVKEVSHIFLEEKDADVKSILSHYWATHKVELIREQIELLNSIKQMEIEDKELADILSRTTTDLGELLIKRRFQD